MSLLLKALFFKEHRRKHNYLRELIMHSKLKEPNKVALASFFIVQEQPNIKHLLVFLAPNIIFIGQMEKDTGRGVIRVQYLSTADQ